MPPQRDPLGMTLSLANVTLLETGARWDELFRLYLPENITIKALINLSDNEILMVTRKLFQFGMGYRKGKHNVKGLTKTHAHRPTINRSNYF